MEINWFYSHHLKTENNSLYENGCFSTESDSESGGGINSILSSVEHSLSEIIGFGSSWTGAVKSSDIIGTHPYFDAVTSPWRSADILEILHQKCNKSISYTEMAYGITGITGMFLGAWIRAEKITIILMESLQHEVAGYFDWNMILNSMWTVLYKWRIRGIHPC